MKGIVVIDPDDGLIALLQNASNNIHICKLQFESAYPRLQTLCSLRLPSFLYSKPTFEFMSNMEWIPTSKLRGSQTSRRRPFPFRSYRKSTIGIILRSCPHLSSWYSMFVSVDALLSVLHSGARHVPWDDWGPAATHILSLRRGVLPTPAGSFWITSYRPLEFHDYHSHRTRYMKMKTDRQSTSLTTSRPPRLPSRPSRLLPSIDMYGQRVETNLPYRTFTAGGLLSRHVKQVVADREWVVAISRPVRCSILLHTREKPIMCATGNRA